VKSVRPSEIALWLSEGPLSRMSAPVQECAFLIVRGTFALAVADRMRPDNPAESPVVVPPSPSGRTQRQPWSAARVRLVIDSHPAEYRAVPAAAASLGLRQGCVLALAAEDIDWAGQKVTVRRQLARDGRQFVFKLPKGGRERVVPLPSGLARILEAHIRAYPPAPCTLPWMADEGPDRGRITGEHTCSLLFRWHGDDRRTRGKHIIASSYDQGVWKPALSRAGIIPPPVKDSRGIHRYKGGSRDDGMHALRHFYSVTLQDAGVPLIGIIEFMGHSLKGKVITVAVYGHVTEETFGQARTAVDRKLFGLHSIGTVTELRSSGKPA
jgi:integrase